MSIMVNSAGANSTSAMISGTLTIKNQNDKKAVASTMSMTRSQTKKKTTKQLNYNHKEISSQIMRAKKTQSANAALVKAKSKVSMLKRCAASGEYDSREVAVALAHAKRMVRCAQMKANNVKQEEQERRQHERESATEERQQKNEVKRRVGQKEQQLKQKMAAKEISKVQQEKRIRQQMVQKRRQHRNQEQAKINEADFKYLKSWANEHYGNSSNYYDDNSGVIVELSAQMQQEIEAEAEAEIEAEISAEMGSGADMGTGDVSLGTSMPSSTTAAVSTSSVDISL